MPPWLDDDFSADHNCLNLDRQNHMDGLVYGMECDTPQYSICMIGKFMLEGTCTMLEIEDDYEEK